MKKTLSVFIKIKCEKCKNEQVIFNKTATVIHCLVCNELLAEPTGGKARVIAQVLEKYE